MVWHRWVKIAGKYKLMYIVKWTLLVHTGWWTLLSRQWWWDTAGWTLLEGSLIGGHNYRTNWWAHGHWWMKDWWIDTIGRETNVYMGTDEGKTGGWTVLEGRLIDL